MAVLELPVVGDRGVLRGDPADRRVELVEDPLVDPVGDPGAEAAVRPVFLDDHGPVGLDDRVQERVEVERPDGAEVDHLGVDALGGELLGGGQGHLERSRVGDQGHVLARAA